MTDSRFHQVFISSDAEPLPGGFGPELVRLDAMLAEELGRVDVPAGLAGRVMNASAGLIAAPASLPFEEPVHVSMRLRRRTVLARFAVAASVGVLCVLAGRIVMQNNNVPTIEHTPPEIVTNVSHAAPLPHAIATLLLDRTPDRQGEEIAYLFDPDPRESTEMSLYVQTREVTVDDVTRELAMLDADLRM